jgi:acid phosphatase type 7
MTSRRSALVACVVLAGCARVAAAADAPVTLVGAGDIATCRGEGDEATARLLDAIPGTVFTLGDNAYPRGRAEDFARCYAPSWGRHRARTRPSPGNHDYQTEGARAYFAYFGAAAGRPGQGWYSYELGTWRIFVLDSAEHADATAQLPWLRAALADTRARCTLAYWHHPLYSSGRHGGQARVRPYWEALHAHGAEIVLGAHDHHYERFGPLTPHGASDPERGIVQFVVGTGGAPLRRPGAAEPHSVVRFHDTHGVLRLDLARDGYRFELVRADGEPVPDAGAGRCHD